MKQRLLVNLLVLATVMAAHSQEIGTRFAGRCEVAGLGTVGFPPGEWYLEFRRAPPNPNPAKRPDYFGFRKVSDPPERLGFRRYDPAIAPSVLYRLLDGIGESLGQGAPQEELGSQDGLGTTYPMRSVPETSRMKLTDTDIAYSFISTHPKRPLNWLCHAHLYSKDGWAFVVIHASPAVLDPDTVRGITWISPASAAPAASRKAQ
jgi:hypothetical protein